jgi:hypothetical protein
VLAFRTAGAQPRHHAFAGQHLRQEHDVFAQANLPVALRAQRLDGQFQLPATGRSRTANHGSSTLVKVG